MAIRIQRACEVEPDVEFDDKKILLIAVTQKGSGVVRYRTTYGIPGELIPGELLPDVRAEIKKEKLEAKKSEDTPTQPLTQPKDTPTQPLTQPKDTPTQPLTQPEDTPTEPYVEGEPPSKRPRHSFGVEKQENGEFTLSGTACPRHSFGVEKQENGEFTLSGTDIVLEGAGPTTQKAQESDPPFITTQEAQDIMESDPPFIFLDGTAATCTSYYGRCPY